MCSTALLLSLTTNQIRYIGHRWDAQLSLVRPLTQYFTSLKVQVMLMKMSRSLYPNCRWGGLDPSGGDTLTPGHVTQDVFSVTYYLFVNGKFECREGVREVGSHVLASPLSLLHLERPIKRYTVRKSFLRMIILQLLLEISSNILPRRPRLLSRESKM